MTVHPEEQSGDLRHGIHTAFLIAPLDHLLGGDVWHTVDRIADALGFRVEPTVALNETHTVSSALAKPVRQNEVSVVANTLRVLCQLCFVVAAGQHMTVGTPDIAPAGAVCFNCPLYQIQIVLGGGIVVVGVVDVGGTEVLGNAREFLHGNAGSELTVDRIDELGIRLILPEAGHQPGDEVGAAGVVVKRHDVQGLGFSHTAGHFRIRQGGVDGFHGILDGGEHGKFIGRQVRFDPVHQLVGVQLNVTTEDRHHCHERQQQSDDQYQYGHANGFQYLLVRQEGYGNLLECRTDGSTHYRPPAFPNSSAL